MDWERVLPWNWPTRIPMLNGAMQAAAVILVVLWLSGAWQ